MQQLRRADENFRHGHPLVPKRVNITVNDNQGNWCALSALCCTYHIEDCRCLVTTTTTTRCYYYYYTQILVHKKYINIIYTTYVCCIAGMYCMSVLAVINIALCVPVQGAV